MITEKQPQTVLETKYWLNQLGLPAIPNRNKVGEGDKKPDSYCKRVINWKDQATNIVIDFDKEYFQKGEGIGTSGSEGNEGNNIWVEFDAKHFVFSDSEYCQKVYELGYPEVGKLEKDLFKDPEIARQAKLRCYEFLLDYLEKYPELKNTPIAKSYNGGYRILSTIIDTDSFQWGCNQAFSCDSVLKRGELIAKGGHIIIPPTEGYTWFNWAKKPVAVRNTESIGIYPVSAYQPNFDIREFATQILEGYRKQSSSSDWFVARCPAHNGNSDNSLHIHSGTGAYICHAGCSPKEIYKSVKKLAEEKGLKQPSQRRQTRNNLSSDEILQQIKLIAKIKEEFSRILALEQLREDTNYSLKTLDKLLNDEIAKNKSWQFITARQVVENTSLDKDWIVAGLFTRSILAMLLGASGIGKTRLLICMMKAIVDNLPFCNRRTKRGKVLFVEVDQSQTATSEYLKDSNIQNLDDIVCMFEFSFLDSYFDRLDMELSSQQYQLVIIDSLGAASAGCGIDENSSAIIEPLKRLQNLAEKHKVAVVIVHHENKSGTERGNSGIRASLDVLAHLKKVNNQLVLATKIDSSIGVVGKNRLSEEFCVAIEPVEDEMGCYSYNELGEYISNGQQPSIHARVLEYLQNECKGERRTHSQIVSFVKEKEKSVTKALSRLHKEGRICKDNSTKPVAYWVNLSNYQQDDEVPSSSPPCHLETINLTKHDFQEGDKRGDIQGDRNNLTSENTFSTNGLQLHQGKGLNQLLSESKQGDKEDNTSHITLSPYPNRNNQFCYDNKAETCLLETRQALKLTDNLLCYQKLCKIFEDYPDSEIRAEAKNLLTQEELQKLKVIWKNRGQYK
ncbi:hypothetical protein C7B80_23825 [Cyanosarcina cf. burmensis CCALA 770]|nr:hypothetical protein C7B80_23825 [Cyanosarcina cf. burmensis CCALA 770]